MAIAQGATISSGPDNSQEKRLIEFYHDFLERLFCSENVQLFSQQHERPSASHEDLNFHSEECQIDDNQAAITDDVLTTCHDKESISDTIRAVMFELLNIIEQLVFGNNQDGHDIVLSIVRKNFNAR